MKKHFFLTILITFLLGSLSHANLDGAWTGSGVAKNNHDWKKDCSKMQFQFSRTEKEFVVHSGSYDCEVLSSEWPAGKLEIRGNQLWQDNKEVGTIEENEVHLKMISPEMGLKQFVNIIVKENIMFYHEAWFNEDNVLFLSIEGKLNR